MMHIYQGNVCAASFFTAASALIFGIGFYIHGFRWPWPATAYLICVMFAVGGFLLIPVAP